MKIWFAGVPGGGRPGDCKRERDYKSAQSKTITFVLSFNGYKRKTDNGTQNRPIP